MLVMRRFKLHTLLSIGALLLVHIAAFVTMMVLLVSVQDGVTDLNMSGDMMCTIAYRSDRISIESFSLFLSIIY